MKNTVELLKKLTAAVGVFGAEDDAAVLLSGILAGYGEVTCDVMNNVRCTFGEGRHFLLDAHLDEIGLIVTSITEDGFVKVGKCGGIDLHMLPAYEVSIWGSREIKGIISTLPPHLESAGDSEKAPKIKDISIDAGMTAQEIKKYVSPGDRVTFKRNFSMLLNDRVSASCLDDRAGVCALLLTLERLKKLHCKVTVLFSSQEELGTRGAKIGAYGSDVDEAICVDVSFAYSPGCDKNDCGVLGGGPMIGFSPILNRDMSKALEKTAEKKQHTISKRNYVRQNRHKRRCYFNNPKRHKNSPYINTRKIYAPAGGNRCCRRY